MLFFRIVLLSIASAIGYGILHDQVTARVCVEYFTIGHPPVFSTDSPTLLALGWGTIAIKVRLDDFTTVTRARTLPAATNDAAVVQDVAAALLRGYGPPRPVRLLGVRVAAFQRGEPEPVAPSPQLALEI